MDISLYDLAFRNKKLYKNDYIKNYIKNLLDQTKIFYISK
jgi:hypothetical protein